MFAAGTLALAGQPGGCRRMQLPAAGLLLRMHVSDSSPLARPGKLHGLDHLRTLAIGLVLLFHYRIFPHPAWLTEVGAFGWTGVDLFFVLTSPGAVSGRTSLVTAAGGR